MLVRSADNKVFITQRVDNIKLYPKAWVIPGGHIEPGEHPQVAACREVLEETGININRSSKASVEAVFAFESSTPNSISSETTEINNA